MGSVTQGVWGDCPGELHLPLPKGGFPFQRAGYQSTLHVSPLQYAYPSRFHIHYTPQSQKDSPLPTASDTCPKLPPSKDRRQRGPYLKQIIAVISSCVITPAHSYRNRDLRREPSTSFSHCLAPKLLFLNTELSGETFPTVKGVGRGIEGRSGAPDLMELPLSLSLRSSE